MSPDYRDAHIVLMDYSLEPNNGDMAAALVDNQERELKVYSRNGDKVTLMPIRKQTPLAVHVSCEQGRDPGSSGRNRARVAKRKRQGSEGYARTK